MTAALAQLDQLENLPLDRVLDSAIEQNEPAITELNRDQLDKGLDSNNRSLGRYSSIKYKGRFEPVDLLDKNEYRSSFYVDPFGKGFEVKASDVKTPKLQAKYGPDINGVPIQDLPIVGEILADALINHIRQSL